MLAIGLIGAGHVGTVLAKRLVALGHSVKAANSRGPHTLGEFALQTGARPVDIAEVATGTDILIIAIPFGQARALPRSIIASLPPHGVIIDTGNYVPPRDGAIAEIDAGLPETAWVSRQLGAPVVKAFNNITDDSLEHNGRSNAACNRIALPVSSDDTRATAIVMQLVEQLGFTAFDAGPLSGSWRWQIGQRAYCVDPTLPQLKSLLARADQGSVARNREQSMQLMAKLPANMSKKSLTRVARVFAGLGRANPANWFAVAGLALAMMSPRRS